MGSLMNGWGVGGGLNVRKNSLMVKIVLIRLQRSSVWKEI